MKKLFFIFLVVAATIAGCSKKDSQVSGRSQTILTNDNSEIATKQPWYPGRACLTWRSADQDTCLLTRSTDTLCGFYIGCESGRIRDILVNIDELGNITSIRIVNGVRAQNGAADDFYTPFNNGTLVLLNDCPIEDEELLGRLSVDYIKAGTYTVEIMGSDAVIVF